MGSRPFAYGIELYRDRMLAYMSDLTITENCRKLRYFSDIFLELKKSGRITTTDPRHMGCREIEAFMGVLRQKKISSVTKKSYLKVLSGYLQFFENDIISTMKRTGNLSLVLKGSPNPIRFIRQDDLQKIFDAAEDITGYRGIMIRGFMALAFSVAGRPKEIIGMHIHDIDLENNKIFIRHPKGEGSYGKMEWISIVRKDMIPRIKEFLEERGAYLAKIGIESPYVFLNTQDMVPLNLKSIRQYKTEIERMTKIPFQLKDLRSTYATMTYAAAPELKDAISKQMRHSNTSITEKYYIAYDQRAAATTLHEEWKKTEIRQTPKKK